MNIFKKIINLINGKSSESIETKAEKQVEKEIESKTKVEEPALVNNSPINSNDKKIVEVKATSTQEIANEVKATSTQETAKEIKAKVRRPQPQNSTQSNKPKPKYRRRPKSKAKPPIEKPTNE